MISLIQNEIDETLNRIQAEHKGVIGVVVANSDGVVIRSTATSSFDTVENYPGVIADVVERARQVIKDNDELTFLKIRTKKVEYIVVPDKEFTLITLLSPSNESSN